MAAALGAIFHTVSVDHAVFCILGILVSLYALYVEVKKSKDPKYVAICDFNDNMSCSRVLTSEYSKGFGLTRFLVGKESSLNVPNCTVGIVFFTLQLILGIWRAPWCVSFLYYSSVVSCLGCAYLAYVLTFILHDVCVVCMATYVFNFSLLYLNHKLFYT